MKKTLLILILITFSLVLPAQSIKDDYYKGVEYSVEMKLSHNQIQKIRRLEKTMQALYTSAGKEKGKSKEQKSRRKDELIVIHMKKMQEILTEEQIETWDKLHGKEAVEQLAVPNKDLEYAAAEKTADMKMKGVVTPVAAASGEKIVVPVAPEALTVAVAAEPVVVKEEIVENIVPESRVIKRTVEPTRNSPKKAKENDIKAKFDKLDKDFEEITGVLQDLVQEGEITEKELKKLRKKLEAEMKAEKKRLSASR